MPPVWHEPGIGQVRRVTTQPASVAETISHGFDDAMQVPASRPMAGNCRQFPAEQYSLALQVRPHMPQLRGSFCWSKHEPLQPIVPVGQGGGPASTTSTRQLPPVQYSPVAQVVVQLPQWPGSLRRSKQTPLHTESGAWQVTPASLEPPPIVAQVPITHASLLPHERPHEPQFVGLERVSTHWPLQLVWPVAHEATQAPAVQALPAAQALPHAPQ